MFPLSEYLSSVEIINVVGTHYKVQSGIKNLVYIPGEASHNPNSSRSPISEKKKEHT